MSIRKASTIDLSAIQALNLNLFRFEQQFTDSYSLNWTLSGAGTQYFIKRIHGKTGIVYVAETDGVLTGYVCGYTYIYKARKKPHMAEIENVYVEEQYRKQGIGTALINAFIGEAKLRGAKTVKLSALIKNTSAQSFYQKHGFDKHEFVFEKEL